MTTFSYEGISRELLRALRGSTSQPELSEALGFHSNVVYTWESGRRFPEVNSFFRVAERAGVPVRAGLSGFFPELERELASPRALSPRGVQRLVQVLVGTNNKSELAARLAVNRTTLARWLNGKTEPRLPEFLRLVDAATQRLMTFVGLFVNPSTLPSTRAAYQDLTTQRRLAYDMPWSHAVLRALELAAYQARASHDVEFLAAELGVPAGQVEQDLAELAAVGQIQWDGAHYRVARVLTVDTREQPKKNRALKAHWASVALSRLEADAAPASALFSFNLFAISEDAYQRVRELHLDYYDRVRAIIEQSPTADRVVLLNLQLLPLRRADGVKDAPTP